MAPLIVAVSIGGMFLFCWSTLPLPPHYSGFPTARLIHMSRIPPSFPWPSLAYRRPDIGGAGIRKGAVLKQHECHGKKPYIPEGTIWGNMKTEIVKSRVPETLKRDFEAVAAARGWDIDRAIHKLMEQYVAYEKEMSKRREEAVDAIEEIDAGRTIDGDRVMDWLSGWGTKDEIPPPL